MAGWNGSIQTECAATSVKSQSNKSSGLRRGALAGLVVVAVVGAALFFLLPSEKKAPKEKVEPKRPVTIKEVEPAATPKTEQKAEPVAEVVKDVDPDAKWGTLVSCATNDSFGMVIKTYRDAKGKMHEVRRPSKPSVFKHNTDRLFALALCHDDRRPMPPLPLSSHLDKQFLNSLKDPIVINPDDPEGVVAQKQTVIEARQRIKEMMDGGASFAEVLADHRKLFNENAQIRAKAASELQRIVDEGDTEGTRQYLLKMNLALQQMGIREIEEPVTTEERRALNAQKQAEREQQKESGNGNR